MAKKKRTKAERSAAAKKAWVKRRAGKKFPVAVAELPSVSVATPNVAGYEDLYSELLLAGSQAAFGKGKERHANSLPFTQQPIFTIGRTVGPAFNTGQAIKKAGEAQQMFNRGEKDKAVHELQGAIVYLASAIALMRE